MRNGQRILCRAAQTPTSTASGASASATAYRSAAGPKLAELDDRFGIFRRSRTNTTLDLAGAPGGFSQVALERMARSGGDGGKPRGRVSPLAIGVDVQHVKPAKGLLPIRADLTAQHHLLQRVFKACSLTDIASGGAANAGTANVRVPYVVLHDGVVVLSTDDRKVEKRPLSVLYQQAWLAVASLRIALQTWDKAEGMLTSTSDENVGSVDSDAEQDNMLGRMQLTTSSSPSPTSRRNGFAASRCCFVTKVIGEVHRDRMVEHLRMCFERVAVWKPPSSREESRETYIVCRGRRPELPKEVRAKALYFPPKRRDFAETADVDRCVWRCWGCGSNVTGVECPRCVTL